MFRTRPRCLWPTVRSISHIILTFVHILRDSVIAIQVTNESAHPWALALCPRRTHGPLSCDVDDEEDRPSLLPPSRPLPARPQPSVRRRAVQPGELRLSRDNGRRKAEDEEAAVSEASEWEAGNARSISQDRLGEWSRRISFFLSLIFISLFLSFSDTFST